MFNREFISSDYSMHLNALLNRYFLVATYDWDTSKPRYSYDVIMRAVPGDVFRSNVAISNAIKVAALYRMKMVLSISVGGTLAHSGCLLVGVTPPAYSDRILVTRPAFYINTLMSCPHGFLYANEATSIELNVPWYCNTDYASTYTYDDDDQDYMGSVDYQSLDNSYGSLIFFVLNPLASGGGSNTVQVTIQAKFIEMELKVPAPRYPKWISESIVGDVAKGVTVFTRFGRKVTSVVGDIFDKVGSLASLFTGLHNPNVPVISTRVINTDRNFLNTVDNQQFFEKLDPYVTADRVTDDFIFGTNNDEMLLREILSKEQFVATFSISTSDTVGKVLFSRPIAPWQGDIRYDYQDVLFANNINLIYLLSRAWNGDFEIVLRSSCTNKQQFKLLVNRYYHPPAKVTRAYPEMKSIANSLTQILEFSAGGQEHVIQMPFLGRTEVIPVTREPETIAFLHGVYYIYLSQVLTIGDNAPSTAEVNVFIRSKNLNFYGYAAEGGAEMPFTLPHEISEDRYDFDKAPVFRSEGFEVMNKPQPQKDVEADMDLTGISNRLHPIISVRDYVRRMYLQGKSSYTYSKAAPYTFYRLSDIFDDLSNESPLSTVCAMFYGRQVGFKIKINFKFSPNSTASNVIIKYAPPNPSATSYDGYGSIAFNESGISVFTELWHFPLIESSSVSNVGFIRSYEFTVPNLSPLKFNSTRHEATYRPFFIGDHGKLIFQFSGMEEGEVVSWDMYVGLTDESRLGFHTRAPLIKSGDAYYNQVLSSYAKLDRTSFVQGSSRLYYTRTP